MRDATEHLNDLSDQFEVEELEERFEMRWIDVGPGGGGGGGGGGPLECQIGGGPRNPICPVGSPANPY